MYIKGLDIHNYRAFQKKFHIDFSRYITAIAGMNGIGKSTILAILSNSSELKKKDGTLLDHSKFRGDFSDIIYYDPKHDTPGDKATVYFSNKINSNTNKIDFRATIQDKAVKNPKFTKIKVDGLTYYKKIYHVIHYKRYRLIPKREAHGWTSSAKYNWPVAYLGLSRIYPIGESHSINALSVSPKISNKIIRIHSRIMGEKLNKPGQASFANLNKDNLRHKKSGTGINTSEYSATSNSSGQDDLGKIILTILSFEHLKKHLGESYNGGLVTIDELDVTLHPAAQRNLLNWLYKEAKDLSLQIVFTTHSISLLHCMYKKMNTKGISNKDIRVDYLRKKYYGGAQVIKNPPQQMLQYDLYSTYPQIKHPNKVNVLTEDSVARMFFRRMMFYLNGRKYLSKINFIKGHYSWEQIVRLFNASTRNMDDFICVLDPDINKSLNKNFHKMLNERSTNKVNNPSGNIFTLPGDYSIEKMIWDFISHLDDNDPLFKVGFLLSNDVNLFNIHKFGPFSKRYNHCKNVETRYKHWYRNNKMYIPYFMNYWIKKHSDSVKSFGHRIALAIERVYSNMNRPI